MKGMKGIKDKIIKDGLVLSLSPSSFLSLLKLLLRMNQASDGQRWPVMKRTSGIQRVLFFIPVNPRSSPAMIFLFKRLARS
jgi:hypothetical protein